MYETFVQLEKGAPYLDNHLQNVSYTWLFCISTRDNGLS